MKPRHHCSLPQAFFVCLAPIIACVTAHASPVTFNEQITGNGFVFPTGTNLLSSATSISPTTVGSSQEGSSSSWAVLTDGQFGLNTNNAATVTPANGTSVTYTLDAVAHPEGYTITSFDSYCGWANNGRDNQDYTIAVKTVANPTFTVIASVANHTAYSTGNTLNSTHTTVIDTTGVLATGVTDVQITFSSGQENGYTGFREFILRGAPTITSLYESNTTGVWTLPPGINLLNGNTATPNPAQPNHGGSDIASSSWNIITDGTTGTPANYLTSVTPNNGETVTFPLDLSVNTHGYNITSFDGYAAWANGARDDQNYSIRYSTWDNPDVFIPLTVVNNHTVNGSTINGANVLSTHTRLAPASGFMATNVAKIQLYFNEQENGYAGYREFVALGTASPIVDPLTWTGLGGAGGNATWVTTTDNNWKGSAGASATFDPNAQATFDDTGINPNIGIPTPVTAASITLANSSAVTYTFTGQPGAGQNEITSTNGIASTGSGSVVFNALTKATTTVTLAGSGSLTFNAPVETPVFLAAGTGVLTLNAPLTGNAAVTSGTLNITDDFALQFSGLQMVGGTASFPTSAPNVDNLSGTGGTIVLGSSVSPVGSVLTVGDDFPTVVNTTAAAITQASGDVGSFIKAYLSTQVLAGDNTYTGPTTVQGGVLNFAKELSLYHGNTASWTASNLVVSSGARLGFHVGSAGEFTDADLAAVNTGGFASGSTLGINTTADFTFSHGISGVQALRKSGATSTSLTLTGSNSFTGPALVASGALNLANPSGAALSTSSVILGDATADMFLNFGASNQLGSGTAISFNSGSSTPNAKVNLRGTTQTVGGLDSPSTNRVALIQNDETGTPGYVAPATGTTPAAATLIIDTATNHSFYGLIRNQNDGVVSVVKNGPGTQEFGSVPIAAFGYTGTTTINNGTLKLNFTGSSFASNITINSPGKLEYAGNVYYAKNVISGSGKVLKTGPNIVVMCNGDSSYSGGTDVNAGILVLDNTLGTASGAGDGPNEHCIVGLMDPSNVLTVNNGGLLVFDKTQALGASTMVAEHAVSVVVKEGGRMQGGQAGVIFVPNVTLDGGAVDVGVGANTGLFGTNIAFVGTVVVGGTSTVPSTINAPTTAGPYANVSLGSGGGGIVGTTFQVADVTSSAAADLNVSAILQNVHGVASPLTKTGPGTMKISSVSTYTGTTHVVAGTLSIDNAYLAAAAPVSIDTGATLDLNFAATNTIDSLTLGGVAVVAGTYGSTTNTTPGIIKTAAITGTGLLQVTNGPVTATPFETYASVITDPTKRGKADDADGDGFTNFQEYLFGLSPIAADGSLTTMTTSPTGLTLRWSQRSGVTYVLQESTDLETWTTSGVTPGASADQSGIYSADYMRMEAVVPFDGAKKFVRVQATENP